MFPTKPSAGFYVHIPFCVHKCGFCDFYSTSSSLFSYHKYFNALIKELALYETQGILARYHFDSLYLGGGTPSVIPVELWKYFFEYLSKKGWDAHFQEVTIEVNPEDVSLALLQEYKNLGINRLSLGVQSLDEASLQSLERRSSLSKNISAIESVADLFTNYSLDLMYGIEGQNLETELLSFASFFPPHISTYALTIYPGTPFAHRSSITVNEDLFLSQYQTIRNFLLSKGYIHYEISNFSKVGYDCLHNQHYWSGDYYLGLGSGASGFLEDYRYTNAFLKSYFSKIEEGVLPYQNKEVLEGKDRLLELFLLQIRTKKPLFLVPLFKALRVEEREFLRNCLQKLSSQELFGYDLKTQTLVPNVNTWLFSDFIAKNVYNVLYN